MIVGTAHVAFSDDRSSRDRLTFKVGRIVFRCIIDLMEDEYAQNANAMVALEAAYGIKYLYFGAQNSNSGEIDFGPAFLRALRQLRENGPPDYYPQGDLELFEEQIKCLEDVCKNERPMMEDE